MQERVIDLRSDTLTLPTLAMRQAMANAKAGDDCYGEDPTVNELQNQVAKLLEKEAALFLPSGSMANQAALMALTQPGDTLATGDNYHTITVEKESTLRFARLKICTMGEDGTFSLSELEKIVSFRKNSDSPVRVIGLENTVNFSGGAIMPLSWVEEVTSFAKQEGISVHFDGARLWNAVVATDIPASVWTKGVDTVNVCLSKGLGAPVGSLVCGTDEVIQKVRTFRKWLGGSMRQAGILAAAGSYALTHHMERLAEDHRHAKLLAQGLKDLGFAVDPWPETNIVMFSHPHLPVKQCRDLLWRLGIKVNVILEKKLRAVLHLDIRAEDVAEALLRMQRIAD